MHTCMVLSGITCIASTNTDVTEDTVTVALLRFASLQEIPMLQSTCIILCCIPQCQSVITLMCDWWMAGTTMKGEWRSARGECGGLCVMISGVPLMLWWFADSWDYLQVVE